MKQFELKIENKYGNNSVAIFSNVDDLIKYMDDNPLTYKFNYYIVIIEKIGIRYTENSIRKIYGQ